MLFPVAGNKRKTDAARPPLRRELAEIGLDLVEEHGFDALTFASLAERAGVDEAQVRTQFHTIYDVVFAQSRGQLEWLSAALADRVPGEQFPTVLDRISSEYLSVYTAEATTTSAGSGSSTANPSCVTGQPRSTLRRSIA